MTSAPCIPDPLPLVHLDWRRLTPSISRATRAVARYDGMVSVMVSPTVLLSPFVHQEAVLSSRIEGTQASLSEVLQHEAGQEYDADKRGDIHEVINYRNALALGERSVADRPIGLSLIRELHALLMRDVRRGDFTPGAFRTTQNWIGTPGSPMADARFVPPDPILLTSALDNLAAYIAQDDADPLVQAAIVHAQFEILHPFNDGNGRLGRMLIPLLLHHKRVLHRPVFYISEAISAVEDDYRRRLLAITSESDWHGWIEFFLAVLTDQAERNLRRTQALIHLHRALSKEFASATRSPSSQAALDAFFTRPILGGGDFARLAHLTQRSTSMTLLRRLVDAGLIAQWRPGAGRRSGIYALERLLTITDGIVPQQLA